MFHTPTLRNFGNHFKSVARYFPHILTPKSIRLPHQFHKIIITIFMKLMYPDELVT